MADTDEGFDRLVAAMDSAMVVVTTIAHGERSGCLVGFHSQVSIEPRRYVVWISRTNHTFPIAMAAEYLVIHLLTSTDRPVAAHWGTTSGDDLDKFDGWDVREGPGGVPILEACPNHLVGRRVSHLDDGGDHVGVVIEAVSDEIRGRVRPLRLADCDGLDAAHDPD